MELIQTGQAFQYHVGPKSIQVASRLVTDCCAISPGGGEGRGNEFTHFNPDTKRAVSDSLFIHRTLANIYAPEDQVQRTPLCIRA